jgi:hypothetical protein
MVYAGSLTIHTGAERIVTYRPEPPFKYRRSFCGKCGTSLGEILSDEELFPVSVNCFDQELDLEILFHEHVASKPSWCHIPPGSKQFDSEPSRA